MSAARCCLDDVVVPSARCAFEKIAAGKRILCVGMGGGCDAIFAYALGRVLCRLDAAPSQVVYGNACGVRSTDGLEQISPSVWCMKDEQPRPLASGETGYGQTLVEQSLPRGPLNCPLIVFVEKNRDGDTPATLTARNVATIVPQIDALGFDLVIGVDAGGDSVTGGIDWTGAPEFGRDRQMLAVLSSLGAQFLHVVFAPGCDGESTEDALRQSFDRLHGLDIVQHSFAIDDELLALLDECARPLARNRTPNIVVDCAAQDPPADHHFVVPRMAHTRVPFAWMRTAVLLKWPPKLNPSLTMLTASQ